MSRAHKFFHEQPMLVESELFCGRVTIVACLDQHCTEHDLPRYGVAAGDRHFTFCEMMLKPAKLN